MCIWVKGRFLPIKHEKRKKEEEEKNEKGRDKNGLRTGRKNRRINRVI